jgi:hypothetical protein
MFGPGKYDDVCKQVKESTKAKAVLLVVVDGEHGHGISCKMDFIIAQQMPNILRAAADEMERGNNKLLKLLKGEDRG